MQELCNYFYLESLICNGLCYSQHVVKETVKQINITSKYIDIARHRGITMSDSSNMMYCSYAI